MTCSAHGTKFSLETGAVEGPWCPNFPDIPFIGKGTKAAPLPTFQVKVEGDSVQVMV